MSLSTDAMLLQIMENLDNFDDKKTLNENSFHVFFIDDDMISAEFIEITDERWLNYKNNISRRDNLKFIDVINVPTKKTLNKLFCEKKVKIECLLYDIDHYLNLNGWKRDDVIIKIMFGYFYMFKKDSVKNIKDEQELVDKVINMEFVNEKDYIFISDFNIKKTNKMLEVYYFSSVEDDDCSYYENMRMFFNNNEIYQFYKGKVQVNDEYTNYIHGSNAELNEYTTLKNECEADDRYAKNWKPIEGKHIIFSMLSY